MERQLQLHIYIYVYFVVDAPVHLWAYFALWGVCVQLQLSFNKQTSHAAPQQAATSANVPQTEAVAAAAASAAVI